jgi:hypothetical protein
VQRSRSRSFLSIQDPLDGEKMIKIMLSISFLLVLASGAKAQSAEETSEWMTDFIANNGGDVYGTNFSAILIGPHETCCTVLLYGDIKSIEIWTDGRGGDAVHISGLIRNCNSAAHDHLLRSPYEVVNIKQVCDGETRTVDVDLRNNATYENCVRLRNALKHMAALVGNDIDKKQPF